MSLTWHIAKKDIRRMGLPIGGWLVFIVVSAAGFRLAAGGLGSNPTMLTTWTGLIVTLQFVMGYLLAGALVLEEPIVGTTGFWKTRPIPPMRLLLAKAIALALLFVLAPAIALAPAWLWCGFSAGELLAAARDMMIRQGAVTVVAAAIAALSPSLRHFLLSSLGLAVVHTICGAYVVTAHWVEPLSFGVRQSRTVLIQYSIVPFMAAILLYQFLTRNTRRGWALIAAGLVLTLVIRIAWPWDIMPRISALAGSWPAATRVEDAPPELTIARMSEPVGESAPLSVQVGGGGRTRGIVFAPQTGQGELRWPDGATEWALTWRGGTWADAAALQLWAPPAQAAPLPWEMVFRLTANAVTRLRAEPATFRASMLMARMRGRVVGKLPLKRGAEISSGAFRTRIVELLNERESLTVTLEERDAAARWDGFRADLYPVPGKVSCYLLVTGSDGKAQTPPVVRKDATAMHGFSLGFQELVLAVPGGEVDLERDASLVLVRFEPDDYFMRPLTVERLTLSPREKQP